jgi:hypothetical protein
MLDSLWDVGAEIGKRQSLTGRRDEIKVPENWQLSAAEQSTLNG